MTVGDKIRKLREKRLMTQEELANKSGLSRTTIAMLESNNKDVITNKTIVKLAKALDVKPGYFF